MRNTLLGCDSCHESRADMVTVVRQLSKQMQVGGDIAEVPCIPEKHLSIPSFQHMQAGPRLPELTRLGF